MVRLTLFARTRRLSGALLLLALTASVAHAQATIDGCEAIKGADAYNQCLAKFGPTSKVKSLEPEKPSDFKSSPAEAAATASAKAKPLFSRHGGGGRRRGRGVRRSAGGRKHMSFTVRHRHR